MRKFVATLALIGLVFAALPAQAHHHGGGNGGAIVGGIIAGAVIGSILTAPRYSEPRYSEYYEDEYPVYRRCRTYFRGYDYYGQPVYVRRCR